MPTNMTKGDPAKEKMWSKAKSVTKSEYPNVREGTDKFYKITMGIFKKMTKTASSDEMMDLLLQEGSISKYAHELYYDQKKENEVITEFLTQVLPVQEEEKQASEKLSSLISIRNNIKLGSGTNFKSTASDIGKNVMYGVAAGTGLVAGKQLIDFFSGKIKSKVNDKTRIKRLKQIAKFYPSVKQMDYSLVNQGLKDLENLNPEYAKSPLIAGQYLKSIEFGGGLSPEMANILKSQKTDVSSRDLFTAGYRSGSDTFNTKLKGNVNKNASFNKAGNILGMKNE